MRSAVAWVGLVAGMLAPALAAAQPGQAPYAGPPGMALPAPETASPPLVGRRGERKLPSTALWSSILVTGAGVGFALGARAMDNYDPEGNRSVTQEIFGAIGAIALVVGPTTGHVYAGRTWSTGLGIRIASAAVAGIVVAKCIDGACSDDSNGHNYAFDVFVASVIGYGVGTLSEIASAPGAAEDYNRAHAVDLRLSVIPIRDARNATSPGVGLVGRF